ncbi:MAG: DUF4365 domain-containing protein [bacterium]|nr:DUF4365 domain-containing protein [bacterium]
MSSIGQNWSKLNHLQVGRYAEQLIMMEFTLHGFSVFGAEVDDRGIDLVVRTDAGRHYDVQVKSVRGLNYIFFAKSKFPLSKQMLAAVVLFPEGDPPKKYLIPSTAWRQPTDLLAGKDYDQLKSAPEWGINLSSKNMPLLEQFDFGRVVGSL